MYLRFRNFCSSRLHLLVGSPSLSLFHPPPCVVWLSFVTFCLAVFFWHFSFPLFTLVFTAAASLLLLLLPLAIFIVVVGFTQKCVETICSSLLWPLKGVDCGMSKVENLFVPHVKCHELHNLQHFSQHILSFPTYPLYIQTFTVVVLCILPSLCSFGWKFPDFWPLNADKDVFFSILN